MKTEEILRYDAEYEVMKKLFGTCLLTFDFPGKKIGSLKLISYLVEKDSTCKGDRPVALTPGRSEHP